MEINNADGTTFTQTVSGDYKQKLIKMLDTLNREVRKTLLQECIRLYQVYISQLIEISWRCKHVCLFQVCFHGAWVENKGVLMTYHYRQVPQEKREELIEKAKKLIVHGGFKVNTSNILFNQSIELISKHVHESGFKLIHILFRLALLIVLWK